MTGLLFQIADVHAIGLQQAQGLVLTEAFYWDLNDGTRQWRGLLTDPEIISRFRCIAFDRPWYGKSSPPEGWWRDEYRLTTAIYVTMIRAVSDALGLDRPVVMGCSIGGCLVLDLAARHADAVRAVIGLQFSAHVDPYYDTSWTHKPDVHGGEVCADIVSGMMAPQSPADERELSSIPHPSAAGARSGAEEA